MCMSRCVIFPHRREFVHQRYLAFFLIFGKSWTVDRPLLTASLFPPLLMTCSSILGTGYDMYHISFWFRLHICDGLGFTWWSVWKVDNEMSRSQQYFCPSISGQALPLPPWCTCHKQLLILDTWHEAWVNANTYSTCISSENFNEVINRVNAWVTTKIKLMHLVHLNFPIPPIIKLPSCPNHILRLATV